MTPMNSKWTGRPVRFIYRATQLYLIALLLSGQWAIASDTVPAQYFGLHMHRSDSGTRWPATPFGAWRLWDASVAWPNLQPSSEAWDLRRLDLYLAMARLKDVEILLPLGLTPTWASSRPNEKSAYEAGNAAEPRDIKLWRRYVEAIARRYKGRISAYEIWNEPDQSGFFSGDVNMMVRLTCEAYAMVKGVDPAALMVSPAATLQKQGIRWLDVFLSTGGARCIDVVGFHFYTLAHEPPEAITELASELTRVLRKHGLQDKPVWNTESGWYIQNKRVPINTRWHILSPDTAAAYVSRALVLAWVAGIRRFYWYAWDNGNYGLIEPDTGELKSSAVAYRRTANWMIGSTISECIRPGNKVFVCPVVREGRKGWIVWRESGEDKFAVPSQWGVTDVEGITNDQTSPIETKRGLMVIGEMPVLLKTSADTWGRAK